MNISQTRHNLTRPALAIVSTIAVAGVLGACSTSTTTSDAGNPVVEFGGQDWECLPVPEETMGRVLEGESNADGEGIEVEKSAMVQGVDNNFIAADLVFPGESKPFTAVFTTPIDGAGPITSATAGTAQLFNWPETPQGKLDGASAAEKCVDAV